MGLFTMSLDTIYSILSVEAVVDEISELYLDVIDKTDGVDLSPGGTLELPTLSPACAVRAYQLEDAGVTVSELVDKTISFNGNSWKIINHHPKPTPEGEDNGEYYLELRKRRT